MAKKITFHSYKGGSGRSSTTLNTLPYIAEKLGADAEHPILLLDTDIDSAGMTYLLNADEHFAKNVDVKSFLKAEISWRPRQTDSFKTHGLLSHFVPVGEFFGFENDAILFFGVNDTEKIDDQEISGQTEDLLIRLEKFADNNPNIRAVIMDSASGEQTVARFATNFAETIVCCMRPTIQFRKGTFRYLRYRAKDEISSRVVLLPTVVPVLDVEINGIWQRAEALRMLKVETDRLRNTTEMNIDDTFINEDCFGINEVQRFKWQESLLYTLEKEGRLLNEDEIQAASRYEKLAEILVNN